MNRHHPLQWRPLQNPFPLEGEGWDGGGVPLFLIPAPPSSSFPRRREPTARTKWRVTHCQPEHHPRHSRAPFRHSREGGNPRPRPGGNSPTVSRSTTPVIPAPPSVIPAKAGTHGPDQVATHPQSAGAPPPSFPRRASPDSIPNHHHVTTIN